MIQSSYHQCLMHLCIISLKYHSNKYGISLSVALFKFDDNKVNIFFLSRFCASTINIIWKALPITGPPNRTHVNSDRKNLFRSTFRFVMPGNIINGYHHRAATSASVWLIPFPSSSNRTKRNSNVSTIIRFSNRVKKNFFLTKTTR